MSASDVCSRLPTSIKSPNLHANDIRGVMGEIVSYDKRN